MKTMTIAGREMKVTPEMIRRFEQSLAQWDRLIAKELAYSEDLQNKEVLAERRANREQVAAMLEIAKRD